MRNDSTGRFERLQCVRCGAHVLVRVPVLAAPRCEVCGGDRLEPVQDLSNVRKFPHRGSREA